MKTENTTLPEVATALGFTLSIDSGPRLEKPFDGDSYMLAYTCRLVRNGKDVWTGPYYLGSGHLKPEQIKRAFPRWEHDGILRALVKPGSRGINSKWNHPKTEQEANAYFLEAARRAKVVPALSDVLASLISDGAAFFDRLTFQDWAAEFGYSDDSIKAKATYNACFEIGGKLLRALNSEELD